MTGSMEVPIALLEQAPHGPNCQAGTDIPMHGHPCTCWKATLLPLAPDSGWAPREHGVPPVPGIHPNARQIIAHTIARRWQELMPDEFNGRPIEGDYTLAERILEALEAANNGQVIKTD